MQVSVANTSDGAAASLTDAQFGKVSEIALHEFGLSMPTSKKPLVHSRLSKRMRELGLNDFDDYIRLCVGPGAADGELTKLLSALTTNVTHFFRERHHFDLLREEVLPPLLERAQSGGRVRLWSAGCSSGQEAYSLAMTILEMCPQAASLDIKILATDIDPAILEKATTGVYEADAIADEDRTLRSKYFADHADDKLAVGQKVKDLVSFGQINLIANWPVRGPFDVIFCRNVTIYFDKPTQASVWKKFVDVMAPDGYLMIGHSERLSGTAADHLESVGVTAYRMSGAGSGASKSNAVSANAAAQSKTGIGA